MLFFFETLLPILFMLSFIIVCPFDTYVRLKLQKEETKSNS